MLLNEEQAAQYMNCSIGLLRKFRQRGGGPSFHRVGRLIRYSEDDLREYLDSNRIARGGGK